MLKNFAEADRLQITVWRVRISWWIPKATNTHSDLCNNYCVSITITVPRTRLSVSLYAYCVSCFEFCVSSDSSRKPPVPAEMSKKEVPKTSCPLGPCDVFDQKSNLQILVNLPVTGNKTCVIHTTKKLGL